MRLADKLKAKNVLIIGDCHGNLIGYDVNGNGINDMRGTVAGSEPIDPDTWLTSGNILAGPPPPRLSLCMIVRNEARRLVTRRRTIPVADGWETRPADAPPPAAGMIASEQAVALRSAFARLGDDCRQLLGLMLADPPLSYDEIAAALDRPRGSLGPSRQRCLDHLRRLLPAGLEIRE